MIDNAALFAIALPDLRREEGLRLDAYPDPLSGGDPWTIGYGHTGPEVRRGVTWTLAQAEVTLEDDAAKFAGQLDHHLAWWRTLGLERQAVILDMAFNMGVDALLGFHNTLALIQRADYEAAAKGMLASRWGKQVGSRAIRLAKQMATGEHAL